MNVIFLNIVVIFHYLVIAFVVLVPFFNSPYLLLMHSIIIPFILLHWITNNNTCALTLMEQQIRKNLYGVVPQQNETFMEHIINPIYDFTNSNIDYSTFIYIFIILLWCISVYKLIKKYKHGDIQYFSDLFKL